ncbi:MAG: hypothetical protein WA004_17355 [Saprospiraceae bacterium]
MKRALLFLIAFLICVMPAFSQQPAVLWHKTFGGSEWDQANFALQTSDGGYIVAGNVLSMDGDVWGTGYHGASDIFVVKLDPAGGVQWKKSFGGSMAEGSTAIREMADGGFILAGHSSSNDGDVSGNHGLNDAWIVRLDESGNIEWQRSLGGSGYDYAEDIKPTPDGGAIFAGRTTSLDGDVSGNNGGGSFEAWVVKLDASGGIEWQKPMGGTGQDEANSIGLTSDGGYIVAGMSASNNGDVSGNNGGRDAWVVKLDDSGSIEWQQALGGSNEEYANSIQQSADGGYILAGSTRSDDGDVSGFHGDIDFWVVKLDETGQLQWQRPLGGTGPEVAHSVLQTPDGGFVAAGYTSSVNGDVSGNNGYLDFWVVKLTSAGDLEWQLPVGGPGPEYCYSINLTNDGGYVLAGYTDQYAGQYRDFWVVKLFNPNSALAGRVHLDPESDCLPDPDETPLEGWLVRAEGQYTFYDITDAGGHFFMPVDTGSYEVTVFPQGPYWEMCNSPASIVAMGDTLSLDFPAQPLADCPYLSVDISAPLLRRCFDNAYFVHYCNHGTAAAEDAYVEVTLDPFMEYISSAIPFSQQDGNTFTFPLGDLAIGECGSFHINVYLDCDSTVLGQTHCTEAHIFPDSLCTPPDPLWDGASISVEAQCTGDSVVFFIINNGEGAMAAPLEYIIIEDQIVLMQGQFQLGSMEAMETAVEATGATLHLEAQQSPGHPSGRPSAGATAEGCGGWLSIGLFTQWANEGGDLFTDTDCQENIGSYDPNDKTGFPAGFTEEKLIEPGQELEYLLRFQNTGTDTAFTVVVADVLPPELDLTTLRPGASSHPYSYSVDEEGRPLFTFNDILLPDSATNLEASNGFVRFRIAQQPGLPLGTEIANKALIYFDFNEPVETNTEIHRLGEVFPWGLSNTQNYAPLVSRVRVVPNPLDNTAWLEVEGAAPGALRLTVASTSGKVLRVEETFGTGLEFRRGGLPAGLYFFRIEREGALVGIGKMVIRE